MTNQVEKDRLSAYVDPFTTKMIDILKKEIYQETGMKPTIGQCIDYVMRKYAQEKEE